MDLEIDHRSYRLAYVYRYYIFLYFIKCGLPLCLICYRWFERTELDQLMCHHVYPKEKLYEISYLFYAGEIEKLKCKLWKIVFLCRSCHSSYHLSRGKAKASKTHMLRRDYELNHFRHIVGFSFEHYYHIYHLVESDILDDITEEAENVISSILGAAHKTECAWAYKDQIRLEALRLILSKYSVKCSINGC